jgi:hypothetical protein
MQFDGQVGKWTGLKDTFVRPRIDSGLPGRWPAGSSGLELASLERADANPRQNGKSLTILRGRTKGQCAALRETKTTKNGQ